MRMVHKRWLMPIVVVTIGSFGAGSLPASAATNFDEPAPSEQVLVWHEKYAPSLGCEEFPQHDADSGCLDEPAVSSDPSRVPQNPAPLQSPASPQPPATPQPPVVPQPPTSAGQWCYVNGQWVNVPPGTCIIVLPGSPQSPPTGGPGSNPGVTPGTPSGGPDGAGPSIKPEIKPTLQPTWQVPMPKICIKWIRIRGIPIPVPYPCWK